MLIDTHTHLYLEQFEKDRDEVISRAVTQGVGQFYLPNIDSGSIDDLLSMEKNYPGRCFAMMGLHPCSVKENYREELAVVRKWLDRRPFCAIGEIGIDLYWDKSFFGQQEEAFRTQIGWALEFDLPIVIHSRDSTAEILRILGELKEEKLRGIFHCFGGTAEEARQIFELGFYIGIGGVLTFKKSGLDQTMKALDLERVVLETDSPYLSPVPFRGKRNESGYLRLVAEKLADIKGMSLEEVADITSRNAGRIFGNTEN